MNDRQLIEDLLSALEYHTEQTRPIEFSRVAIEAACEYLRKPARELVAVHQFRSPHCSDWYDGFPDPHDGRGPYETRTLYTRPQAREWVGLTHEEIVECIPNDDTPLTGESLAVGLVTFAHAIEAKLREKNT